MAAPSQTPEYKKGFAAGRKRAAREDHASYIYARKQEFRNKALLAALPEFMRGNWTSGGKTVTTIDGYISLAVEAANKLTDKAVFVDDREMHP